MGLVDSVLRFCNWKLDFEPKMCLNYRPACVNGICAIIEGAENCCICETGWQSASCDTCAPYWECPNQEADACQLPNECRCSENETDPKGLCNNPQLIKLP